jgi:hypothetical protein
MSGVFLIFLTTSQAMTVVCPLKLSHNRFFPRAFQVHYITVIEPHMIRVTDSVVK